MDPHPFENPIYYIAELVQEENPVALVHIKENRISYRKKDATATIKMHYERMKQGHFYSIRVRLVRPLHPNLKLPLRTLQIVDSAGSEKCIL